MMVRLFAALVAAAAVAAIAACVAPPPPDAWGAQAVAMAPLNSEPWVGTQTPSGRYQSSARHLPFQTPNSLPAGAWTAPSP